MVLLDATPLQSEHRLRGVGVYVRELLGAVERLGYRPDYLLSSFGPKIALPPERSLVLPRSHFPAQGYFLHNELFLRYALLVKRPQVFFAPDFNGLVTNPFGVTVAALHDLTPFKLGDLGDPLSTLRWRVFASRLGRIEGLVAVSESSKRDAVELLGIDPQRIKVVHHGVDHERFKPSVGLGKYADSPPYLLHIGGRNQNKNQQGLLEAFAHFAQQNQSVNLCLAGPWSAADLEWLEGERKRLGLGERVKHLGYIESADLPSLYGNAQAFVFPSLEEGFGLPVLEAMACGAPVITSKRSSLPEAAGEAALLVDPRNREELVAAMVQLTQQPLSQTLREAGYIQARRFTWEATARRTWEAIEETVEGRG
jgi:glycosyltransferase involved in cell wall biosynthesis